MDSKNKKQKIINAILLLISIGILLYFCISNNNLITLISVLPELNYFWFTIAILSMFMSWLSDSLVIHGILSDIYSGGYSKFLSFKLTMTGQYFSAITPFGVGGQPVQVLKMTEQGVPAGTSISVLVRKFLIYQSTMAVYSFVVIIVKFGMFSSHIPAFVPLALVGFGSQCFTVLILVLFYINRTFTTKIIGYILNFLSKLKVIKKPKEIGKKVEDQLNFFIENNKSMRGNRKLTIKLYILTFIQFTALFAVPFFIYKTFHGNGFPFIDMISTQAFVTMISSYTPLPGAAGTTEGSFLMLFGNFFSSQTISPAMILSRFLTYYFSIISGFIIIRIKNKRDNYRIQDKKVTKI